MAHITLSSAHILINIAVNDILTNQPTLFEHKDPETLIRIHRRTCLSTKNHLQLGLEHYPMTDADSFPKLVQSAWTDWVNQAPVFGLNSGKYGALCEMLSNISDVNVLKKDNMYVFLINLRLKFLDVRNYFASGLSYEGWCKANGCSMEELSCLSIRMVRQL